MYYEVKTTQKINASQAEAYEAITRTNSAVFAPFVTKSYADKAPQFNRSTPSWCVKNQSIAWEQTRNNTVSMRGEIKNCKIRVQSTRYELEVDGTGVKVELIVGYRTLAKSPFKFEEFDNYLGVKIAMAQNLEQLRETLERTREIEYGEYAHI